MTKGSNDYGAPTIFSSCCDSIGLVCFLSAAAVIVDLRGEGGGERASDSESRDFLKSRWPYDCNSVTDEVPSAPTCPRLRRCRRNFNGSRHAREEGVDGIRAVGAVFRLIYFLAARLAECAQEIGAVRR